MWLSVIGGLSVSLLLELGSNNDLFNKLPLGSELNLNVDDNYYNIELDYYPERQLNVVTNYTNYCALQLQSLKLKPIASIFCSKIEKMH